MKKLIITYILNKYSKEFWLLSGNIAQRFHDKDTGEYDDLQDRFYYWITQGIKDF